MNNQKVRYSEIIPDSSEWPIMKLSREKKEFIDEVIKLTFDKLIQDKKGKLREDIEMTIHREKIRMKNHPWRVDPADDYPFWKGIQSKLATVHEEDSDAKVIEEELVKKIIERYANEISGSFKKNSYILAKKLVTFGFARLLNAARVKGLLALFSKQLDLDDKLHVVGETEHIRELAKKGTVVLVPTHFSNIDSILIGWVIQYLGLPPFIYGAGLNLFNIRIFAFFMRSLGAYKVDRRKMNTIYLETLKTYSRLAMIKGCHSLFFPGGTRSRSGEIETKLKLGLLSTAIEAQREMFQRGDKNGRVFIVPVTINYHFTLEAPILIRDYLRKTGRERYYREVDEYSTSYKIATFLLKFISQGSDISVSIGKGMDILGNLVDSEGVSYDKKGNRIATKDYFLRDKKITVDHQREKEYVRVLSKRIVEEYHKYNRVFASHLVAFTAFKMLESKHQNLDLYSIIRLADDDLILDYNEFKDNFNKLRSQLDVMYEQGRLRLSNHMKDKERNVIDHGIKNVGLYHNRRPLVRKKDKIIIQDTNTLYYYHNRMNGYELERFL